MAYNALAQADHNHHHHHQDLDEISESSASRPNSPAALASSSPAPSLSKSKDAALFLDNTSEKSPITTTGLSQMVKSIASRSANTSASYDMVEDDDYEEGEQQHAGADAKVTVQPLQPSPVVRNNSAAEAFVPLHIPRPRPRQAQATDDPTNSDFTRRPHPLPSLPTEAARLRTASGGSVALRHPTPDLQARQGAYVGNIRNLEATAERLSMTSSIDDAIKALHDVQKQADSRRSSLLSGSPISASQEPPPMARKFSNSSIIEMNKISRGGGAGYTSAGFVKSPKGSLASKTSKYGSRPEPELEGRPLDSFVTTSRSSLPNTSPVMSRSASIAEQYGANNTMTRPITDIPEERIPESNEAHYRPKSPAPSTSTFDQAQKMFADFDGVHTAPEERSKTPSQMFAERTVSQLFAATTLLEAPELEPKFEDETTRRRLSQGNRLSTARPQTYADPDTGQQMVYYPAPVPMMLNLPHKLSKLPPTSARNQRRSQVMSSLPPAARQSAIWLPDVVETGDGNANDGLQNHEYVAQHQRMSMGGRRLTQDLEHMPPQLRANAYFEQPGLQQDIELKEQSAVATLDSILDASAHAPVSAFTDHAFAGHLGNEVYGKPRPAVRNVRSSVQLLSPTGNVVPKKRLSSFFGKGASSVDLLADGQRSSTMPDRLQDGEQREGHDESEIADFRSRADNDLDEEHDEEDENTQYDAMYHGQPTTLLAELQIRKQQQKYRIRPVATAYPNGMHSTLMQLDAVAEVEHKTRKAKRVNLAWEGPIEANEDEDVPLGMLYATKAIEERSRPLGLMEKKDRDDNEPLSARRDRLQGRRPAMPRASSMQHVPGDVPEEEEETLAQRVARLKAQGGTATGLPAARPVSGDFASEMLGQFGKTDKGKAVEVPSPDEEEETLGQRRKRLQAEREAKAKEAEAQPVVSKRRSMANILQAHPAAGSTNPTSYGPKPTTGLLGLHEQQQHMRRSSTMLTLENTRPQPQPQQPVSGMYNDGQGNFKPIQPYQPLYNQFNTNMPQFAQPTLNLNMYQSQMLAPFANPYAMGYTTNAMQMGYMPNMQTNPMANVLQMSNNGQPLNQGQIDMVERWRQSVMQ